MSNDDKVDRAHYDAMSRHANAAAVRAENAYDAACHSFDPVGSREHSEAKEAGHENIGLIVRLIRAERDAARAEIAALQLQLEVARLAARGAVARARTDERAKCIREVEAMNEGADSNSGVPLYRTSTIAKKLTAGKET